MNQALPFRDVYTVTLDGSGNGAINVSPTIGFWMVEQVAVIVSTNTNEPEFQCYIDGMFVGGSYSGSRTSDTTFNQRLNAQQRLNAVWLGGDPDATATLILTGKKYT